jgi:hypothetical protein
MSALSWHGGEFLDEQMNARKQRLEAMSSSNPAVEAALAGQDSSNNVPAGSSHFSENGNNSNLSHQGQSTKDGQGQGWNDPILLRPETEPRKPSYTKDERKAQPIFRIKQLSSEQIGSNQQVSGNQWAGAQDSYDHQASESEAINEICRRLRPLEIEDPAAETQKLREQSRSWAVRETLTPSQIIELEMLMNLVTSTYIPRSSIEGLRQIDKGTFNQCHRLFFVLFLGRSLPLFLCRSGFCNLYH